MKKTICISAACLLLSGCASLNTTPYDKALFDCVAERIDLPNTMTEICSADYRHKVDINVRICATKIDFPDNWQNDYVNGVMRSFDKANAKSCPKRGN